MEWFDNAIQWLLEVINNPINQEFFWRVVNAVVLYSLIVYFVRKYDVINKVFGGYQQKIQREIDSAKQLEDEAAQIKRDIDKMAEEAVERSKEILEKARVQAQREKVAAIESAKASAERILDQARQTADYEHERQMKQIQTDIVERTLERAREEVAGKITKRENDRLVGEFLDSLNEESVKL